MSQITRDLGRYVDMNSNEKTTYQNVWDIAKAMLSGKLIIINAYIKKEKRFQNPIILP